MRAFLPFLLGLVAASNLFCQSRPLSVPPRLLTELQALVAGNAPMWQDIQGTALTYTALQPQPYFHITNITNGAGPTATISPALPVASGSVAFAYIGGLTGSWAALNQTARIIAGGDGYVSGTITSTTTIQLAASIDTTSYGTYTGQDAVIWSSKAYLDHLQYQTSSYFYDTYQNASYDHYVRYLARAYLLETNPTNKAAFGAVLKSLTNWFVGLTADWGIITPFCESYFQIRYFGPMIIYAADYGHDLFTATELQRMGTVLKTWSDFMLSTNPTKNYAWGQGKPEMAANNYWTTYLQAFLIGADVLYEDSADARTLYTTAASEWSTMLVALKPPADVGAAGWKQGALFSGYPVEGEGYGRLSDADVQRIVIAHQAAAPEAIDFAALGITDWFKKKVYQAIYARRPDMWGEDQHGENFTGDGPSDPVDLQMAAWWLGTDSIEGQYARWFYRNYGTYPTGTIARGGASDTYVANLDAWWDRSAYGTTDYRTVLPPYYYDGEHQVIWKTGWGATDQHWNFHVGTRQLGSQHGGYFGGELTLWRGLDPVLPSMKFWTPQYNISQIPGPNSVGATRINTPLTAGPMNSVHFGDQDAYADVQYNPLQQWTPALTSSYMFVSANMTRMFNGSQGGATTNPFVWWNRAVAAIGVAGASTTAVVVDRIRLNSANGVMQQNSTDSNRFVSVDAAGVVQIFMAARLGSGSPRTCALSSTPAPDVIVLSGLPAGLNGNYHCLQQTGIGAYSAPIYQAVETVSAALQGFYCPVGSTNPSCNQSVNFTVQLWSRPKVRWNFNVTTPSTRVVVDSNTASNTVGASKLWITNLTQSATMGYVKTIWSNGQWTATPQAGALAEDDIVEVSDASQNSGLDVNLVHVVYSADSSTSSPPVYTILQSDASHLVVQAGSFVARFSPAMVLNSGVYKAEAGTGASFTSSFAGYGTYVIGQLAPATYRAYVNSVEVAGSPFTVGTTGSLRFQADSGVVVISQAIPPQKQLDAGSLRGTFK